MVGFSGPKLWIYTTLFATVVFGFVAEGISDTFCFTCAGRAVPIVPLIIGALLLPFGAGYSVRIEKSGVTFKRRFLGIPYKTIAMSLDARVVKSCSGPSDSGALLLVDSKTGRQSGIFGARRTRDVVADFLEGALVQAGGNHSGWMAGPQTGTTSAVPT
jgi:hypothetical protein